MSIEKLCVFLAVAIALVQAYGSEPVINLVADAGGSTSLADNSAAFMAAVALSTSTGYPIYVPPGTYSFTRSINSTNVIVRGAGAARSVFIWRAQLGLGIAAYDIHGTNSIVEHLGFSTSYGRPALGAYIANFYGIRLNDQISILFVTMQGFYAGLVWNSGGGHTVSEHIHSSNNYYGLYVQLSNGDNYIGLSGLEGNTMASIGIPSNGGFGSGDAIYRTHMCFGPYGVYQEGPDTSNVYNNFLHDAHFQLARFESCGNGAIYTENYKSSTVYGGIRDTELYNVGFSWNTAYKIASRTAGYAVEVGTVQAPCYYFPGASGFSKGANGTWNLHQANNWGNVQQYETQSIVVSK